MFDLNRLQALLALAREGSIAAAAEALGFTPSAVSQQLTKLEREVQCQLLERSGRRVRLTDSGLILAEQAARIQAAVEQAEAELAASRGAVVGHLRIAAFPTGARGLLPDTIRDLVQRFPNLEVNLLETDPEVSIELVARGNADIGVVHDWHNTPLHIPEWLNTSHVGDDVADIALPSDHPLAGRESVDLHTLVGERWVSSPPGIASRDWLVQTFRNMGVEPNLVHQVDEYPTQLALVAAGLGIALVPRLGRGAPPAGVHIARVAPTVTRRILTVWRAETARRPSINASLQALSEHAAQCAPSDAPARKVATGRTSEDHDHPEEHDSLVAETAPGQADGEDEDTDYTDPRDDATDGDGEAS